jgi:hypothetical protein
MNPEIVLLNNFYNLFIINLVNWNSAGCAELMDEFDKYKVFYNSEVIVVFENLHRLTNAEYHKMGNDQKDLRYNFSGMINKFQGYLINHYKKQAETLFEKQKKQQNELDQQKNISVDK